MFDGGSDVLVQIHERHRIVVVIVKGPSIDTKVVAWLYSTINNYW